MGSCISKCIPQNSQNSEAQATEKDSEKKLDQVQDKLVIISQTSTTTTKPQNIPLYNIPNKISPSPPSPSPSSISNNSSLSSFTTCPFSTKTTSRSTSTISISNTNSCSSSSTSSSSSKDRSFSNDFLWSCYKENPHIIRINSIKHSSSNSNKAASFHSPHKGPPAPLKKNVVSQKRVRSSSPSNVANDYHHLTRQMSFRRDIVEKSKTSGPSSRRLASRSPSPSRRFIGSPGGDNCILTHSKSTVPSNSLGSSRRVNALGNYSDQTTSFYSRKERSTKPSSSPKDISRGDRPIRSCLRTRDQSLNNNIIKRCGTKIDGEAVISDQEFDYVLLDDIDNPLISLDCFIFL
ncbi:uncharacterized serine-rich protein C215.13 [Humulus lupulus]|uniref:uncharacterized serine-rich protein C215.13 n=1 Tax=Humulus lupulus TaxID=3486 RepID=UPI002B40DF4C|nr:uncharacterized serine-rich protein C215.13 [Humulus lupulus]